MAADLNQYFRIGEKYRSYKGDAFFRINWMEEKATKVCFRPASELRKGRSNTVGIYLISKISFMSNYMPYAIQPCTKKQFDNAFSEVVTMLK